MAIVESTDHFLQTVYQIQEGISTIAVCYTQRDAEIVKSALEKDREEQKKDHGYYENGF